MKKKKRRYNLRSRFIYRSDQNRNEVCRYKKKDCFWKKESVLMVSFDYGMEIGLVLKEKVN